MDRDRSVAKSGTQDSKGMGWDGRISSCPVCDVCKPRAAVRGRRHADIMGVRLSSGQGRWARSAGLRVDSWGGG